MTGAEDASKRPIVAFDFDGTLTVTDSFMAFLRWRTTRLRWWGGMLRLAPSALAYLLHRDRGRLKSAAVAAFLRGTERSVLSAEAAAFAAASFERLIRPDALAAWRAHLARGERVAIVTASPEEIVAPFAERLGAHALIGSRLEWTAAGRVGYGLAGPNCRGREKVARLKAHFGEDAAFAQAYGDTSGDREMLAFADRGAMRAFTGRP